MAGLFKKIFGSSNDREVKKLKSLVQKINAFELSISSLSDTLLSSKTKEFQDRIFKGESIDLVLPEAFAVVREASKRILGERHYDVQLMGGIVLHQGKIAEMKTGEGKTLVSTLPAYLNALEGKGVHIVTVNDYLAQRDSAWMGRLHTFLGLSVGCITHSMDDDERRAQYACDITYATNNELGFDYLRDNMKFHLSEMVQRPFNYAIVDEVDSILIDEARTPLIISGPTDDTSDLYTVADSIVRALKPEHYEKDEKHNNVTLTDSGMEEAENLYIKTGMLKGNSLYDLQNLLCVHHLNQALRAHTLFNKDKDYIVKQGKVVIIDEFTGRMMDGRRYSDGLHQALEAKENVVIQKENQTLASITFQNYFRLYPKLSGMTGTAMTEAAELAEIYNLEVVALPTHVGVARRDQDDSVYRTEKEKLKAVLELVKECHARKQPILIGTVSIEKSEELSEVLKSHHVPHNVLNARLHDQEARIIAEAGRPGAVTIATNMAGRGTDIKLGGSLERQIEEALEGKSSLPESKKQEIIDQVKKDFIKAQEQVKASGGLFVIGTERHESRRIDNQLRGRSGRQGDVGASKFFLSLQDDLMRIFGSERLDSMLVRLGLKEDEAIIHPWINKAIERAQGKVEARNFDTRKHLLKYDDVMNDQRKVVNAQRREIMADEKPQSFIEEMMHDVIDKMVFEAVPEKSYPNQWDVKALHEESLRIFGLDLPFNDWIQEQDMNAHGLHKRLLEKVEEKIKDKFKDLPESLIVTIYRGILLRVWDQVWKEHLLSLDYLRQGIGLRSYGQKDPLNEYKSEAFILFEGMLDRLKQSVIGLICHFSFPKVEEEAEKVLQPKRGKVFLSHGEEQASQESKGRIVRKNSGIIDPKDSSTWGRVQRNALCPCGSGKKYKQCHGTL